MIIKLVGSGELLTNLQKEVEAALAEIQLSDFVAIESTDDENYKTELGITANPALCIEESSIEFRDMIFEGIVPERSELVSMFASIFGASEWSEGCGGDSCAPGGCGSCHSH